MSGRTTYWDFEDKMTLREQLYKNTVEFRKIRIDLNEANRKSDKETLTMINRICDVELK